MHNQPNHDRETAAKLADAATEAVQEAQTFFLSLGLVIQPDGLIANNLDQHQLQQLRYWNESTSPEGILMPTEQDFYRKTLLAVSLWPQHANGNHPYLLGKGVGVEIALRGKISGRIKRPVKFSYRTHSDLELYGIDYPTNDIGENLSGVSPYPPVFKQVFGAQETFPLTRTKGLKNIPPTLLHQTSETVDLGGISVRVPQLELLFLDKFIASESTPRAEGYDHELLAAQYVLDRAVVHRYLDQLVIQPATVMLEKDSQRFYQRQLDAIKRFIQNSLNRSEGNNTVTLGDAIKALNEKMQSMIENYGADSSASASGIQINLWQNLQVEQMNSEGVIVDQGVLQRLRALLQSMESHSVMKYQSKHQEIDALFDKIEKESQGDYGIPAMLSSLQ